MGIFKKPLFKFFIKLISALLLGCFLFSLTTFFILKDEKFSDTYQSVIQRKYERLKNETGKKIIIVGGSNAGFGINTDELEKETGYPVINMGLHAGFGPLFNTTIVKNQIAEGDIVLLAHEYKLTSEDFSKLGDINLIMSAIDNNLEMYREIPLKNLPEVLGNLVKFAKYKASKNQLATGVYSSKSFDEKGNMIFDRPSYIIEDYQNNISTYGSVAADSLYSPTDDYSYLKELHNFIESKGAEVYFIAPVLLEDAYIGTPEDLENFEKAMEEKTGIPFISNTNEYLFPSEFMFDTIYHCNNAGEIKRTELLLNDLKANNIIK